MFIDILSIGCEKVGLLKILLFIDKILDIIFIIVPIGLIIMISIDFAKSVIAGDEDSSRKAIQLGFNRLLYAVFLFAVPYIISVFLAIVGSSKDNLAYCMKLANNSEALKALEEQEEAEKQAKIKAKEKAEQEKIEIAKQKQETMAAARESKLKTITIGGSTEGCDGVVYYENGTFYKPSAALVPQNGIAKTKGSAEYGYNKYFFAYLTKFIEAAKEAGYTITYSKGDGAWRSFERQQYFYNCYKTGSCNNGNLASVPGHSNHGWAIASDMSLGNGRDWAHKHAKEYGLHFPVPGESWHIEPIKVEESNEKAKKCL